MKKQKRYSEILQELEETMEKMNRGEISIDELEGTVTAAAEKIVFLREKLKSTQVEITRILKAIEDEEPSNESPEI